MLEEKQTRPSDPEELIRLSTKLELLPCYYCGGEGKLYELNVFGNMIFGIQCEKCRYGVMQTGTKLEYRGKIFMKKKVLIVVPIKDAKERCALKWNFIPEGLSDRKMEEITNRREWKEWIR